MIDDYKYTKYVDPNGLIDSDCMKQVAGKLGFQNRGLLDITLSHKHIIYII